jgi:hypothetical protein
MIGYSLLVFIAFLVLVVGFIIVGVAIKGWRDEAKLNRKNGTELQPSTKS